MRRGTKISSSQSAIHPTQSSLRWRHAVEQVIFLRVYNSNSTAEKYKIYRIVLKIRRYLISVTHIDLIKFYADLLLRANLIKCMSKRRQQKKFVIRRPCWKCGVWQDEVSCAHLLLDMSLLWKGRSAAQCPAVPLSAQCARCTGDRTITSMPSEQASIVSVASLYGSELTAGLHVLFAIRAVKNRRRPACTLSQLAVMLEY